MGELEVRGVSKRLGGHQAVDDVSFTVATGELFVILGTSGSGKSTLLRLICGLERPDAGQILLDGREIHTLPPRQRNLGMVFQDYGLYPAMDVRGNIAYGLESRGGLPKDEIQRRVVEAAGKLGLGEMLGRSTQDLSGGEQQRVALARAMVKDADAYLFDEPLSNLDPKLRHHARRDIVAVHREKKRPSVYVTHDQSEAFAMADLVAVMSHGRVQQVSTPDELLSAPANTFVARFVGSPPMNLVPAALDGGVARASGVEVPIERVARSGSGRVIVGFRPESMRPAHTASAALSGTVVDVEEGFVEQIVRFTTGDGTEVTAVLEDDLPIGPGDPVAFDVDGHVHLFDPVTEQAIPRA
ncbi:ABC transporter ATP-binding protein [Jiangella aurantiaca]|uniref:ABC transporter ATP-binding protein n=1 Tax=Jiangella aurantiaca TaxID=2530373 RepID=A0A4R5ALV6_9ACTN|nr:ABC transporter ATP-binding protein [Jiangella aurantiaca]TDD72630.1 ABC transporter ATP-binding protein [Jiangella aurantiaca]